MPMSHWTDFLDAEGPDGAYLPWKKVEPRVGISRTTAWRLQRAGEFPKPYVMSPGRVAYRESEVEAWKASRGHRSTAESAQVDHPQPPPKESASPLAQPAPTRTEAFRLEAPQLMPSRPTQAARSASARTARCHASAEQITFKF